MVYYGEAEKTFDHEHLVLCDREKRNILIFGITFQLYTILLLTYQNLPFAGHR